MKKQEEGICPVCGCGIEYEALIPDGESIYYPWECPHCHSKGKEVYNLNFVGHEDIQNLFSQYDYICYTMKNELGKVKRKASEHDVFAWFHCGDTASRISTDMCSVVLSHEDAKNMTEEAIKNHLKSFHFANEYAIDDIMKKN